MSYSLPYLHLSTSQSFAAFTSLPRQTLSRTWDGVSAAVTVEFLLAMDPEALWFAVFFPSNAAGAPGAAEGQWRSGLWEYDVAELFLNVPGSTKYQEFNLSPEGAWWTARFTSYRIASAEQASKESTLRQRVEARTLPSPHGPAAALRIPNDLLIGPAAQSLANVTAIIGAAGERQYLSWSLLAGERPDFHRTECFSPLQAVSKDLPPSR